jgi:hypothetical protein
VDIGLRILPLFPNDQALGLFAGLVPASSFVSDKALEENAGTAERQSVVAGFPVWLVPRRPSCWSASRRTSTSAEACAEHCVSGT